MTNIFSLKEQTTAYEQAVDKEASKQGPQSKGNLPVGIQTGKTDLRESGEKHARIRVCFFGFHFFFYLFNLL